MALPYLFRKLFQDGGAGDFLNKEIIPPLTADDVSNVLKTTVQSLSDAEKAQIVTNLAGTFLPLTGGKLTGHLRAFGGLDARDSGTGSQVLISANPADTISARGGAQLFLYGATTKINKPGSFLLSANGADGDASLVGLPSGVLTWNGKAVMLAAATAGESGSATWYKKFEDGFIMQGGYVRVNAGVGSHYGDTVSITFPIPFTSTPPVTIHSGGGYVAAAGFESRSSTGYKAKFLNGSGSTQTLTDFSWFACGY